MVVTPVQKQCREGEGVHLCEGSPGRAAQYCISSNLKCDGRVNCFARDLRTSGQPGGREEEQYNAGRRSLINDVGKFGNIRGLILKLKNYPTGWLTGRTQTNTRLSINLLTNSAKESFVSNKNQVTPSFLPSPRREVKC